jgi:hypothetical protein
MIVDRLVLDLSLLEGALGDAHGLRPSLAHELSFDIAPSSECPPAGIALGDGVVGWFVGQFEGGRPAVGALHLPDELILRHDNLHEEAEKRESNGFANYIIAEKSGGLRQL